MKTCIETIIQENEVMREARLWYQNRACSVGKFRS